MSNRRRPVNIQAEFKQKRIPLKLQPIPPDLFRRDTEAEAVSSSELALFVTKSTDKKAANYERFLKKIENRAVKTDIIVEQLGIDHVSFRKKVSARTSIFFRNQVEKSTFVKPSPTEERIYQYIVAAILRPLDPSPNHSVLEASRARWHNWLKSDNSKLPEGLGRDVRLLTGGSVSSEELDIDELSEQSNEEDNNDINGNDTNPTPLATIKTNNYEQSSSRSSVISLASQGGQSNSIPSSPGQQRSIESTPNDHTHDDLEMLNHDSMKQKNRRLSRKGILEGPTDSDETARIDHYGANIPPAPLPPDVPVAFNARRIAHDVAEIATNTGVAAGNIQRALSKSLKEWELLSTLQKIFQLDPDLNKKIVADQRKRLSNDRSLIFDFSLRVAAMPDHPIYSRASFLSQEAYLTWMQREVQEAALRTSSLSADDHEGIMNLAKNVLFARRQSRFVGKLHIEVLGIGEAAKLEFSPEFGLSNNEYLSWNDLNDVVHVSHPASEIHFDLMNVDSISLPYFNTTHPGLQIGPTSKLSHEMMGTIKLPMDTLAQQREGVVLTAVKLDLWDEIVVVRIVFRWKKDNFYSITDHYTVYQHIARKAMEYDISNGHTGPTFPSASIAELLERYGQRYGVRPLFRLLTDFEIQTEKLIDTGQLEMPVILNAASRLLRHLGNDAHNLNTVERSIVARSIEHLRLHTISQLERYRECFPTTQRISACKTAINLLEVVVRLQQILDGENYKGQSFNDILRDCIKSNGAYMLHMLEGLTEEQRSFGRSDTIKAMAEFILPELVADERFYTEAFSFPVLPISCTVMFQGVTQVTKSFFPDFVFDPNHSVVWFRGFKALKWLNDRYEQYLDRSVVEPFPIDDWYKPSVELWLDMLSTIVHEFVTLPSMETWASTNPGRLHSDLVSELFFWLEKVVLEFLHYFDWQQPETCSDLLTRFSKIASGEVTLLGARMLEFLEIYRPPEDDEKNGAWRQPWMAFGRFAVGGGSARDKEDKKLAAGVVDRKICVLLNNMGLTQKWIERLQVASSALLDMQLKKTDPELRANYVPADDPIEQFFRQCDMSIGDVIAKLMARIMRPLKDRIARDIVDIISSIQKLRQGMTLTPGSKPFKSDTLDVDTELFVALDGLILHITIFIEAVSLVLYDSLFNIMQLRVFETIIEQFSNIVYTESFAAGVRSDPLQATFVGRSIEMIRLYFLEGENALAAAKLDEVAHDLIMHLKNKPA